ncbi:SPRY-domain-containing protein [Backusella circina FSU 941]|nr:SPRY-domain-containing protein [Backusella circina FSU 941]
MTVAAEGVYAVIIVCVFILFVLVSCIGMRILRKSRRPLVQSSATMDSSWHQQPSSVNVLMESVDSHTFESVTSWQTKFPPNTNSYVDTSNHLQVLQKGVLAWRFEETETLDSEEESNAIIISDDDDTITFYQGQGSICTNLPVPVQEFAYWEVKILQEQQGESNESRIAIGLSTKPYPRWRLPGWHRHSVAYHSRNGAVYASNSVSGRSYGPPFKQGDVIGVGYLYQSGTVFFTRNGENLGKASIGFKYPLYPIIGSIGPCSVSVNFGLQDFLFSAANSREAAFAPKQGSLPPPPAYGGHIDDTVLFDTLQHQQQSRNNNNNSNDLIYMPSLQQPPPSYS